MLPSPDEGMHNKLSIFEDCYYLLKRFAFGSFGKPHAQVLEEYSDGLERVLELSQLRHVHLDLEADNIAIALHIHSVPYTDCTINCSLNGYIGVCLDVRGERGEPDRCM